MDRVDGAQMRLKQAVAIVSRCLTVVDRVDGAQMRLKPFQTVSAPTSTNVWIGWMGLR